MRRGASAAAAAALVLGLAACGGTKHATPSTAATTAATKTVSAAPRPRSSTYSLAATRTCLQRSGGVHAYLNAGNKVVGGSKGELRVTFGFGLQWIYIAFGKDHSEAEALMRHAVDFAVAHNPKLTRADVLQGVRVRKNVFYYADGGPVTQFEGSKVERCLR